MKLIDADSLLLNMNNGIQGTAREYLKFYQMAVNDEPTAYDVDKVVERLEGEKSGLTTWAEDEAYKLGINKAIEIAKAGGVNE